MISFCNWLCSFTHPVLMYGFLGSFSRIYRWLSETTSYLTGRLKHDPSRARAKNVLSHHAVEKRPISPFGRRPSYLAIYTGHILAIKAPRFFNPRWDRTFFVRAARWVVFQSPGEIDRCSTQPSIYSRKWTRKIHIWGVSRQLPQRVAREPQIVLFLTHIYDTKMCFKKLSNDVGSFSEIFHFQLQKVQNVLYLKKCIFNIVFLPSRSKAEHFLRRKGYFRKSARDVFREK